MGKGVEQNIVTLCWRCHRDFDQSTARKSIDRIIAEYLRGKYPNWDPTELIYRKDDNQ
jgi:hypothetical protein